VLAVLFAKFNLYQLSLMMLLMFWRKSKIVPDGEMEP
jgi:hypothetical protein